MGKNNKFYIGCLILSGFSYNPAKELVRDCKKYNQKRAHFIMSLLPFNTFFDKYFQDFLSTNRVLYNLKDNLFDLYAAIWDTTPDRRIYPLELKSEKKLLDSSDILNLLIENGSLIFRPSFNTIGAKADLIRYKDENFYKNENKISESELIEYIENLKSDTLITQSTDTDFNDEFLVLHTVFIRKNNEVKRCECYICNHKRKDGAIELFNTSDKFCEVNFTDEKVKNALITAKKVSDKFSEAPYLNIGVTLSDNKIWQVDTGKDLVARHEDSVVTNEFLNFIKSRKKRSFNVFIQFKKYLFSLIARKKGFLNYMYKNWLKGLYEDQKLKLTTLKEKRWAHKRGFYSYRIKQYGLTQENYKEMLSDYDYKRLRPINGRYQKWLWDKIYMYYVLEPFKQYLPEYFCRILPQDGVNLILPFADNQNSFKDIQDIEFYLKNKHTLVLKPAVGSHGKGFYKLSFNERRNKIEINSELYTKEQFNEFINNLDAVYFVSNFVESHDFAKSLCSEVASTIRLMIIDDGTGPKIKYSFFRIGRNDALTDNLDSGGIVAKVDIKSGHFFDAQILKNHEYKKCDIHPDSKLPLEGDIPHWNLICKECEKIAEFLHPMEYLGFDVVVTQDSFLILEINTHQDLHRYAEYPDDVKAYFKKKCEFKNKQKIKICS